MTDRAGEERVREIERRWYDQNVIRERMRVNGVEPSPSWYDEDVPYLLKERAGLLTRLRAVEGEQP